MKFPWARYLVFVGCLALSVPYFKFVGYAELTLAEAIGPVPAAITGCILFLLVFPPGLWLFTWVIGGREFANELVRDMIRTYGQTPDMVRWLVRRLVRKGRRDRSNEP